MVILSRLIILTNVNANVTFTVDSDTQVNKYSYCSQPSVSYTTITTNYNTTVQMSELYNYKSIRTWFSLKKYYINLINLL